jgi:hypothetical protein
LGVALVLAPQRSVASRWQMQWSLAVSHMPAAAPRSPAAQALLDNAMADALPLFEALAADRPCELGLPVGGSRQLRLHLQPLAVTGLAATLA